jgi:arabinofuranan 3-O-arabinosyltransferase
MQSLCSDRAFSIRRTMFFAEKTPRQGNHAAPPLSAARGIYLLSLTLALGYLIVLGGTYLKGDFLADSQSRPIANDFVNVVAAGQLARDGKAATAYDWPLHKQAETRAIGHDFDDYYGWHYPPTFLFAAAALATLPYLTAMIVWLVATLAAYTAAMIGILGETLGRRGAACVALGFPAVLWNVTAGQNGFLTAALIGGTLGLLERRPALAGICLGLLTYKPQFGLLFPLVLIADRRWLTVAVAAAVSFVLIALSLVAFGIESWNAFFHWMPITSRIVLGEGHADFSRLQSVFGFVRAHVPADYGGAESLAWTVQGLWSLALALGLLSLWKSRAPYDLKAAGLAAGALLATPYLYMYDLAALAIAFAFLLRDGLKRGFLTTEPFGFALAGALIFLFPYIKSQTGLAATLIILALIAQRACCVATKSAAH